MPDASMAKSMPAPESVTDCGVSGALSVRVRVAVRAPNAAGVNVTLIAQFAAGATVPLQVSFSTKSAEFGPENEMAPTCRAPVPEFVTVIARGGLALPTSWLAKFAAEGEIEMAA
jgi:hypothetical protein